MPDDEAHIAVDSSADIVKAREHGRALARELGFEGSDLTIIAAAISEIARNVVDHAKSGEMFFRSTSHNNKRGICIIAKDEGPGIKDIEKAMQYGYSTGKGLGVGLPGAKWLVDDFDIKSEIGKGTTVTMKKWLP